MAFYNEEDLEKVLQEEPSFVAEILCKDFLSSDVLLDDRDDLVALLELLMESDDSWGHRKIIDKIEVIKSYREIDTLRVEVSELAEMIKQVNVPKRRDNVKKRFSPFLAKSFAYEFSQGDVEKIQTLINELRTHISQCEGLSQEHMQRLLRRLEKLQSEVHKKVSDLDRFWGLVGEAGVVAGKLGEDAKPIVDRVKEIAKITWNTQSRAEELPSDTQNPMIEHHQEG